jgi:hypothetical protein
VVACPVAQRADKPQQRQQPHHRVGAAGGLAALRAEHGAAERHRVAQDRDREDDARELERRQPLRARQDEHRKTQPARVPGKRGGAEQLA